MQFVRAVRNTPDLQRIKALPRRTITLAKAEAAAARMTKLLCLRPGAAALRPWQGLSLEECMPSRLKRAGGWLSLPVGQGKTLTAELLPVVLGAKRAVLILPASLRNKTYADRRAFVGVWRVASPPPRLISREELAIEANAYLLDEIKPDLIIIDEAHKLRNRDASAVKRIDRYLRANPDTTVVTMTGTPTRRSILGYWHHLRWTLGDGAPVPAARADAEEWAAALDDANPRAGFRPAPGALGETLDDAREWYRRRLAETPGVVIVDEDSAGDIPLTLRVELAPECPRISEAFDTLRTKWESPGGEPISDALSLLRVDGQIGSGLYTYWDPPPPQRWIDARRTIAAFIRKRCAETQHSKRPLDTDAQVIAAHPEHPAVRGWLAVKDMFDTERAGRVKWISDVTLNAAVAWARASRVPSVLWTGSVEFGDRLALAAKLPYYGPQGKEVRTGVELHAADVRKSMVCSWHACREGQNLQAWRRQAIFQPPQSAEALEQIFGRAHRAGQTEPVHITYFATSGGTLDSFAASISEAEFAKKTASSTQKILRATIEPLPTPPESLRWTTKE